MDKRRACTVHPSPVEGMQLANALDVESPPLHAACVHSNNKAHDRRAYSPVPLLSCLPSSSCSTACSARASSIVGSSSAWTGKAQHAPVTSVTHKPATRSLPVQAKQPPGARRSTSVGHHLQNKPPTACRPLPAAHRPPATGCISCTAASISRAVGSSVNPARQLATAAFCSRQAGSEHTGRLGELGFPKSCRPGLGVTSV